jgi:acyl carrier protein
VIDETIRQRVAEIVGVVFGVAPLPARTPPGAPSPEWDSLRHIEIILAVEDEFRISIAEDDFASLRSIDSISAYIAGLRAPR